MCPSVLPEYEKPALFERLPSPRKRLLGFDRHSLEELGRLDLVRIIEVIRPGRQLPMKLVHVPSLIAYIERVEELARNKRIAEIHEGYAYHHPKGALEGHPTDKITFLESASQPEEKP